MTLVTNRLWVNLLDGKMCGSPLGVCVYMCIYTYMNYLRKLVEITWQDRHHHHRGPPESSSVKHLCATEESASQVGRSHCSNPWCVTPPCSNKLEEGKHTQSGQKKCFKDALKVSLKSFEINSQHIQNASTRLVYDKAAPTEVPSLVNRWGSQGHKGKEMCKPWANFLLSVPGGCQCLTCSRSFSAYIRLIDHSRTHCTPSFFPVLPSVIVNTDRLTNNNNTFY